MTGGDELCDTSTAPREAPRFTSMEYTTLGAVDLGSNSFHLAIGRVVDDQIYPLDSLKETVRLGSGLTPDKQLDAQAQERALAALKRFSERLAGMPREAVRVVGTNALRVAKNAAPFLRRAEATLGFPIEIIPGREEARLIYLGVVHSLPLSSQNRLVVDIGGGSTEFIIGNKLKPKAMESLYMGCVSYTARYFPEGRIEKKAFKQAELAAREQVQTIAARFEKEGWKEAVGSSGTARSIAEILAKNGQAERGITASGLAWLRDELLAAGDLRKLALAGPARGSRSGRRRRRGDHVGRVRRALALGDDGRRGRAARRRALGPPGTRAPSRHPRGDDRPVRAPLPRGPGAVAARGSLAQSLLSGLEAGGEALAEAAPCSSIGPRACTRSACRSRRAPTTSIRPTSSPTPTCRASHARSRATCRTSCSRSAASSPRCARPSTTTRSSPRSPSACASR